MNRADAAARVIERLLTEPLFRAEFRRDPTVACRRAGLDELAEELAAHGGKALITLDLRESRSSLAGVMMAAALEGFAASEFVARLSPMLDQAPAAVHDVLSRVNLPAIRPPQGASAPSSAEIDAGDLAASGEATPGPRDSPQPSGPPVSKPLTAGSPGDARVAPAVKEIRRPSDQATRRSEEPEAPSDEASERRTHEPRTLGEAPVRSLAGHSPPESADPMAPPSRSAPIDPGQFGRLGTGGEASAEALALLNNANVTLDADGIADIRGGFIDPRVVALMTKLSEEHEIAISSLSRDHPINTTGGSVSNHSYGRGVDIATVDGAPVNASSLAARDVATELNELPADYRPTEIGTPWAISPSPPYFTDAGHQDHIHIGFDDPVDPSWKSPIDVGAGDADTSVEADNYAGGGVLEGGGANTLTFRALREPPTETRGSTVQFMRAVRPEEVVAPVGAADYPGDDAPKEKLAAWMARRAEDAGLPPELPVMAALVESNLTNVNYGDADSLGFFQMRVSIWNQGEYAGYPDDPDLQMKWFVDTALAVKEQRLARGETRFLEDASQWGLWVADVERPLESLRYKYQDQFLQARALLDVR